MRKNKDQTGAMILLVSICSFLTTTVSMLLMSTDISDILLGSLFWGGLLVGVVSQIVLEIRRRSLFRYYNVPRQKMQKPRNGLLTFCSNREAMIADLICGASLIATVLAILITKGTAYICAVCIGILLFSFCMHCILNGRNYFHINNYGKIRQTLESKKTSI